MAEIVVVANACLACGVGHDALTTGVLTFGSLERMLGAWYIFSQTSDTVTPTTETVNEPIDQARDLEEKATSPSRGTISE